jgi:hypothetical protein
LFFVSITKSTKLKYKNIRPVTVILVWKQQNELVLINKVWGSPLLQSCKSRFAALWSHNTPKILLKILLVCFCLCDCKTGPVRNVAKGKKREKLPYCNTNLYKSGAPESGGGWWLPASLLLGIDALSSLISDQWYRHLT